TGREHSPCIPGKYPFRRNSPLSMAGHMRGSAALLYTHRSAEPSFQPHHRRLVPTPEERDGLARSPCPTNSGPTVVVGSCHSLATVQTRTSSVGTAVLAQRGRHPDHHGLRLGVDLLELLGRTVSGWTRHRGHSSGNPNDAPVRAPGSRRAD